MNKIGIALVLTLLLAGCGKEKELLPSKESKAYQLKFEDYMNCYRLFYQEQNGTSYYTMADTIKIKFDNTDWMDLDQAIAENRITMKKFISKEKDHFKKCEPTNMQYPCNGGCLN